MKTSLHRDRSAFVGLVPVPLRAARSVGALIFLQ